MQVFTPGGGGGGDQPVRSFKIFVVKSFESEIIVITHWNLLV